MPRSSIGKKELLAVAVELVREGGEEALNARAVAKAAGVSTQPVYSLFHGMEGLKDALYEEATARYYASIEESLPKAKSRYEAFGLGFVRFAREEKGLFRFLFLGKRPPADSFFSEIVREMVREYRMTEEEATSFHADMMVFSFGLAALVNQRSEALTEEEIEDAFSREFCALYGLYFPHRPRFWEQ